MITVARGFVLSCVLCVTGCITPKEVFPPMHPQWSDHISRQSRHYANFPGKPKLTLRETKTVTGQTASTYLRELEIGNRYYGTAWTLVPAVSGNHAANDRLLEVAAAAALNVEPGAKLVSSSKVAIEGNRGLTYIVDLPKSGMRLRQQIFLVSGVLVEQTYTGPAGTELEREPGRFFDSLKLLP